MQHLPQCQKWEGELCRLSEYLFHHFQPGEPLCAAESAQGAKDPGGVLLQSETSEQEALEQERNERHQEIITSLFAYAAHHPRFTLEEYWNGLSEEVRERVCQGNTLLMVMLQLYEMSIVSVGQWQESEESVFEPRGEDENQRGRSVRYYTFCARYGFGGDKEDVVNLPLSKRKGREFQPVAYEFVKEQAKKRTSK